MGEPYMGNNNLKTQHENEANNKRIGATLLLEEIDSIKETATV